MLSKCPHQGDDPRFLHWLICPLQRWMEIKWLPNVEPVSLTVALLPPLLIVSLPLFWKAPVKISDALIPLKPVLHLRAGWRRDMNSGTYLLSFAAKVEERSKLW